MKFYTSNWPLMGDLTLAWSQEQAAMMEEVIQKKMDEGYTFFVKDDEGRELRLRAIADLQGRNAVQIGDRDAEALIRQGKIGIVDVADMIETDSEVTKTPTRRTKSAREAAQSNTVATRRMGGG